MPSALSSEAPDRGVGAEEASFVEIPEFDSLGVLRATYHNQSFPPHFHTTYALGLVEDGSVVTEYRGSRYVLPAGSIVSINPGEVHTGAALTPAIGWRYRMLYPSRALVRRIASDRTGRPISDVFLTAPAIVDADLARALHRLHVALEYSESILEEEHHLYDTFGLLIDRYASLAAAVTTRGREHAAVARVKEYLDAHISSGVSLSEIARLVSLSPFHLCRVFRQATGLPPYAYFEQLRIERAKELLRGGLPILDVAVATGFCHQGHLTRRFKRMVGVSPGTFARGVVQHDLRRKLASRVNIVVSGSLPRIPKDKTDATE